MIGAPRLDGVLEPRLTPDPSTPQGGQRRYVEDEIAIRNLASGVYQAVTSRVRMKIPSMRLMSGIALAFKPDATEDATIGAGWVATLQAWKATKSGLLVRTNDVLVGQALPFTYEAQTSVDEWRLVITAPNAPGTGTPAGVWYVIGSWEPVGQELETPELQKLFQLCRVAVEQPLTVSNTGA